MLISDWSSDVCSSDLQGRFQLGNAVTVAIGDCSAFGLQGPQMRVAVDHEFARRHVVMADFLFDAGDAQTGGPQQRYGVGVKPALKQRDKIGITCAVLAYATDALAIGITALREKECQDG